MTFSSRSGYVSTLGSSAKGSRSKNQCGSQVHFGFPHCKRSGECKCSAMGSIEIHLAGCGYTLSQNAFQQGLLKNSRENGYFIGSFDSIPRGYFIIDSQHDAELMRNWYRARISKEEARIKSLTADAASVGWSI